MRRFQFTAAGILVVLLMGSPFALAKDDWSDLEEPFYYGITPPSYGEMPPPPQPVPNEEKPWYKKIFNPITKHFRPPIYQVKKYPKEEARETVALPEPLIRLGSTVQLQERVLEPGFYLLRLSPGEQSATIHVVQQQQVLASIPATRTASKPPELKNQLPDPPAQSAKANKPEQQKHEQDKKAKTPEATAWIQYAEDGQSLYMGYKTGDEEYLTIPLPILTYPPQQLSRY